MRCSSTKNKARTKLSLLEGEILERNKIEVDVKE